MREPVIGLALALLVLASGCAVTQQTKVMDENYCPFMGAELCAKLVTAPPPSKFSTARPYESVAYLHYVNPNAPWKTYKSVMLQPVTFWAGSDDKLSAKDQHQLTNYFYQQLEQQLGTVFTMVQDPGPGVMRVQVALEDASTATPVLRSISMVIPQARVLASLKFLATGSYPFVGSAQAEAKITDSETGEVLAAAVDRRVGGGAMATAGVWQMGDAENAVKAWSVQMTDRLTAYTQGTAKP